MMPLKNYFIAKETYIGTYIGIAPELGYLVLWIAKLY